MRSPLRHGRIWRGREILAPEFLMRLFWSPNPLPSFHRSSYCVPSFNLSIATQEDDPPCRPSAQARASKLMMKMCQQRRALSCQILLLQYVQEIATTFFTLGLGQTFKVSCLSVSLPLSESQYPVRKYSHCIKLYN